MRNNSAVLRGFVPDTRSPSPTGTAGSWAAPVACSSALIVVTVEMLRRFVRVMGGVQHVSVGEMRMVGRFLVITGGMMLRGFAMVLRGCLVMLGCLVMVIRNALLVAHVPTPDEDGCGPRGAARPLMHGSASDANRIRHPCDDVATAVLVYDAAS